MRSTLRGLTRLTALFVAAGVWLPAQQTLWFTPLPYTTHPVGTFGSTDYMSLFSAAAAWQQAAGHVQVFKIYGVDNFSDTDLTTMFADLNRRNIALALEWPVLTSSTCGAGIEGFGGNILPTVQRIKNLGGNLTYIAMQQPFQWGALYTGTNSCQWTAQQVAANALLQINQAKTIFPNVLVGDIMAVPPFRDASPTWPAQYGAWFDTWLSMAGAPLAFFHVDADWTVPNWQAAVAQIRPVAVQRGIPFGMVYNGFLTNESDSAWMSAAENHFAEYEVTDGNSPPNQVNFQSWNPNPTHVLPETDPTAFTYLIDRYFRTRTQLSLSNFGTFLSGTLRAGTTPVPGVTIQVTAQPVSGNGAMTTYTITGPVPSAARTALVGARINTECYNCNGPADLTIYGYQYAESSPATGSGSWDFTNDLGGWSFSGNSVFDPGQGSYTQGLHITAQTGQATVLNSSTIAVTPGATFTLTVTARVAPASVGSGYFTLIWLNAAGAEPSRETIMLQPQTLVLGTPTTAADGSYNVAAISGNPTLYQVTATYAGSGTLWPAIGQSPGHAAAPPSIASLAPSSGSGANATFTAVFSDPNGWAAIANAEVLINAAQTPLAGCSISYLPASGAFRLLNDAGTLWSSTALSNSQCTLSGATASGSGNNLTLTLPLTFQASFGSPVAQKQVFLQATDTQGLVAPWQAMGVWSPVTGVCTVTVSPTSPGAGGAAGTVTLTLNGGTCGWTATQNVAWLTPAALSGNTSTLSVAVAANATGAQRSGTVTVAGTTVTITQAANNSSVFPSLSSLTPYQGTGLNANLTFVYSDNNGWAAISSAEFILNPRWETNQRGNGCYIKYAPGTGLFTLIADDGSSLAGTTTAGASNISNSQCTLNAAASSATGSGNNLTVVASLTFSPSFTSACASTGALTDCMRHIWMQASDYYNNSSNWLVLGAWFPTQTSINAVGFYRMYDGVYSHSYYNSDINEYNYWVARGFTPLGEAGLIMNGPGSVAGVSNIAWYRLFVNSNGSHFYTSDRNEFLYWNSQPQIMVGEGVSGFVVPYLKADQSWQLTPPTNMIPFYRAAAQGGALHFWTSDTDEYHGTNGKHLPAGYVQDLNPSDPQHSGIASWIFPTSGAVWNDGGLVQPTPDPVAADDGGPAVLAVVNGASYASAGVIAPGQALSVFGRHLGGAKLLLNGAPAEVISSKDNEIRVVVPQDFAIGMEVHLEVERQGRRSKPVKLDVLRANPAIFGSNVYGRGNAQAQNDDGTINGAQHAAARGSVVTLYTTGLGAMDLPVEVHIGGRAAEVISTVSSATRAGTVEVRVRVPEAVEASAFQPVVLKVGNLFSQPGVGLAIQ